MIEENGELHDARPIDLLFGILKESTRFVIGRVLLPIALISSLGCASTAQVTSIDTAHSKLLIRVSKSGVFSGFADNHEIEAQIAQGSFNAKSGEARLSVDSHQMRVLDPKLPLDKRQQVQERMLGPEVLDSSRFPSITFESTGVEHRQEGTVIVEGRLSLHGVTKPVSVEAHVENGRYVGSFELKQTDFDITPISIAGGTVKVKNELKIEFDIATLSGEKEN
jgi:polyisoprenoid-binding protein YceI